MSEYGKKPGENDFSQMLEEYRQKRLTHLLSGEFNFLPAIETPRPYQKKIVQDTIRDILNGKSRGRWDVGMGGGKTFMALSLANHIAQKGGRILFLTPGNTELNNALEAHTKYKLGESNYLNFAQESDFTDLASPRKEEVFQRVPFYYSNVQMMCYGDRYKKLSPEFFDLVIFDESQGYLGKVLRGPSDYFLGAQLHMSATPYTMAEHVGERVPHVYGKITSQELIDKYGFPKWRIKNYFVDDSVPEERLMLGEDLDFENSDLHKYLNIGDRFLYIENILEEIATSKGRKGVAFLPSVNDARLFVDYIVDNNAVLKGKVGYVAGIRTKKQNKDVIDKLKSGEILVVVCKDLLNQSLDVPELTDVILGDPSRSLRKVTQRIGRGARPAENKEYFYIHDLVSTVFHSSAYGVPAIRAKELANGESKTNGLRESVVKQKNGSSISSLDVSQVFLKALAQRRLGEAGLKHEELDVTEKFERALFMADPYWARMVFEQFANGVFRVSYGELFLNFNIYVKNDSCLVVNYEGEKCNLTLSEAFEIARFYGTLSDCVGFDYLKQLSDEVWGEAKTSESSPRSLGLNKILVEPRLENKPKAETVLAKDYIGTLHMFISKHEKKGFKVVSWEEKEQISPELDAKPKGSQPFRSVLYLQVPGRVVEIYSPVLSVDKRTTRVAVAKAAIKFLVTLGEEIKKYFEKQEHYKKHLVAAKQSTKQDFLPQSEVHDMVADGENAQNELYRILSQFQHKVTWGQPTTRLTTEQKIVYRYTVHIKFKKNSIKVENPVYYASAKLAKQATALEAIAKVKELIGELGFHDLSVIKDIEPIQKPLTIENFNLNINESGGHPMGFLNIMKSTGLIGRPTRVKDPNQQAPHICYQVLMLNGQSVDIKSDVFIFASNEEESEARFKAGKDLLEKLLTYPVVQIFWARRIKDEKKVLRPKVVDSQ